MLMSDAIFVDTWALLALANRKDSFHTTAVSTYEIILEKAFPLVISDYILDETITALFKNARFEDAAKFIETMLDAINAGQIILERIDEDKFDSAWQLRRIYRDKPDISFTDLTSFVVMRERDIKRAFTGDVHFGQVGLGFEVVPKRSL